MPRVNDMDDLQRPLRRRNLARLPLSEEDRKQVRRLRAIRRSLVLADAMRVERRMIWKGFDKRGILYRRELADLSGVEPSYVGREIEKA
jgi:hypothetical protein